MSANSYIATHRCSPSRIHPSRTHTLIPSLTDQEEVFAGVGFVISHPAIAMNKVTAMLIEEHGGTVFRSFSDLTDDCWLNCVYLLAHNPTMSVKYLEAVARNLRCVKFAWIDACLEENYLLSTEGYELPPGHIPDRVMELAPTPSTPIHMRRHRVFENLAVLVGGTKPFKVGCTLSIGHCFAMIGRIDISMIGIKA
ncbi:hypothetical protein SARC_03623 [Sphaeroforma arctica JP610]|uniref:BRCT domain-containing protein n=1 Tax=Sphaeroforma arctica JP610 TaxID=667725 RepID=A0A0L0G556_9EUKA|nr:hypothetical protein SARC_03623 [Sphaeroforma arctica JP610]KNC84167.1 hypothetical protein SARC_03623 [Sphaeroforma arctica JP610]|eukprot:XP_014158069.1 hypothetical protein SARC_03623 [Sphaeroforma arctica JP610]